MAAGATPMRVATSAPAAAAAASGGFSLGTGLTGARLTPLPLADGFSHASAAGGGAPPAPPARLPGTSAGVHTFGSISAGGSGATTPLTSLASAMAKAVAGAASPLHSGLRAKPLPIASQPLGDVDLAAFPWRGGVGSCHAAATAAGRRLGPSTSASPRAVSAPSHAVATSPPAEAEPGSGLEVRQAVLTRLACVHLALGEPSQALHASKALLALPECSEPWRGACRAYAAQAMAAQGHTRDAVAVHLLPHLQSMAAGAAAGAAVPSAGPTQPLLAAAVRLLQAAVTASSSAPAAGSGAADRLAEDAVQAAAVEVALLIARQGAAPPVSLAAVRRRVQRAARLARLPAAPAGGCCTTGSVDDAAAPPLNAAAAEALDAVNAALAAAAGLWR